MFHKFGVVLNNLNKFAMFRIRRFKTVTKFLLVGRDWVDIEIINQILSAKVLNQFYF